MVPPQQATVPSVLTPQLRFHALTESNWPTGGVVWLLKPSLPQQSKRVSKKLPKPFVVSLSNHERRFGPSALRQAQGERIPF